MRILSSSSVQWAWESCACFVADEKTHWENNERLSTLICGVWARTLAACTFATYVAKEALSFAFKIILIAGQAASSGVRLFSFRHLQQVARITFLSLKILIAECFVFAGGVIVPELIFGKWELHKKLVKTQARAFTLSLPDFPTADAFVPHFLHFVHLSKLFSALDIKNDVWKERLYRRLAKEAEETNVLPSLLLDAQSPQFRYLLFDVLYQLLAERLTACPLVSVEALKHMTPFIFCSLFHKVSEESQYSLLQACPTLHKVFHEQYPGIGNEFFVASNYPFRHPHTVELSNILLHKMREARDELLLQKIFTEDEILEMKDAPWFSVTSIGMWRFIESADADLVFQARAGFAIQIKNDEHFFGLKGTIQNLRAKLSLLDREQRQGLFQKLTAVEEKSLKSLSKAYHDPKVQECFQLFSALSHTVVNPQIMKNSEIINRQLVDFRKEDQIPWHEAFCV